MDITFDPLTEDAASGFVLDEDDEAAAEAQQPPGDVLVTLTPATRAAFPADVHAPVLVVAFGAVARSLVHALPGIQLAGSVLQPELSLRGNGWLPRPTDKSCGHLFTVPRGGTSPSPPLVLASADDVPPHRAFHWAAALLSTFRPSSLVVLDEASLAQGATRTALARLDAPVCTLQTDVTAATHGRTAVPLLPPGPLVVGASAALMTKFQASGKPGRCYVYAAPDAALHPGDVGREVVAAVSGDTILQAATHGGAALQWDTALTRAREAGCLEAASFSSQGRFT